MLRRLATLWKNFLWSYTRISHVRGLILGIGVGAASGLAASGFFIGIEALKHHLLITLAGLDIPAPAGEGMFHGLAGPYRPWLVPLFLAGVGLVTGLLVSRFIPETVRGGTDGTDAMINAFHNQAGIIRPRVPLIRGLMAVLTISAGGSAGREGPISQIGAGLGSFIAQRLKLSPKERRLLLLAGAAGGLGAIFRAPLGGALTAIEVIYKEDFEAEAILPSVISSVVAYSIFTFFFGTEPMFGIPHFSFHSAAELPFYALLALFCAGTGWLFIRLFERLKHRIFLPLNDRIGITATMTLGGLAMGILGMVFPQLLSGGYGWLEMAIKNQLPLLTMLLIVFGKMLATAITIGSGLSGGMFAPALFIGGMSGGVVGQLAHAWRPDIATQPGGYVLVGMAAFFAGVANAPIGPLIMVCELTQGYGLLAPLMLSSALCLVLGRGTSLYEHQVDNKFESPAHLDDATINILEGLQVQDFYARGRVTTLEEGTTLKALTDIIANTNELYFPVRNARDEITGILGVEDVRKVLFEDCLFDLVVVGELARKPAMLKPEDNLYTALLKFVDTNCGQIPVTAPDDDNEILGLLNREDVFKAYSDTLKKLKDTE
ncbi:MAG: chloride channel protein [Thermodesulfobacteriota bacterium]